MPTQSTHPRPSGAAPLVHYPLLTAEQVHHLFLMSRTSLWILCANKDCPTSRNAKVAAPLYASQVNRRLGGLLLVSSRSFRRKEEAR